MTGATGPRPEFARPLALERLGPEGVAVEIAADARERAALARRFGLAALDRLSAALRVEWAGGRDLIRVTGRLRADLTQTCVVSLEPVPGHLDEAFTQLYSPDPAARAAREVILPADDDDEVPEPVGPRGLDLGEAVAQQLAVSLDPYPKAPGSLVPEAPGAREEGAGVVGPFAALKTLKTRR